MTKLLKVNENGPAHLRGLLYKKVRGPKKVAKNYIAIQPCKDYFDAKVKVGGSTEIHCWLSVPREWETKASWIGNSKNQIYAMPRSWFTPLPSKEETSEDKK